jgi:murein DD-endopeptidase MepM/ murein hydrolase activator NlpD
MTALRAEPSPRRRSRGFASTFAAAASLAAFLAAPAFGSPAAAPGIAPLAVWPETASPGDALVVAVGLADGEAPPEVELRGRSGGRLAAAASFAYAEAAGLRIAVALLAVPMEALPGAGRVQLAGRPENGRPVAIGARAFAGEEILLDAANSALRSIESPRRTAETATLAAILDRTDPGALWAESRFQPPVDSPRRTAAYGDRRIYRYADGKTETTRHNGVDFGVPTGTQVRAAARGRIALAADRLITGRTVVIEHLPGVYTLYYHLSRLEVAAGDLVSAGQAIGLSGASGLATGPHLHWELRISSVAADPDGPVAAALLDKAEVISRMTGQYGRLPEGR